MLSCREATRLMSEGLDRRLGLRARMGLRLHVAMCKACPRYLAQLKALHELLTAYFREDRGGAHDVRLSDEAKERLKAGLRQRSS